MRSALKSRNEQPFTLTRALRTAVTRRQEVRSTPILIGAPAMKIARTPLLPAGDALAHRCAKRGEV
jgi:hypothetical protein